MNYRNVHSPLHERGMRGCEAWCFAQAEYPKKGVGEVRYGKDETQG